MKGHELVGEERTIISNSVPDRNLPRLTWAEVSARRLERHALAAPSPGASPADIASVICGAHAQILGAGELSIGLRLANGTRKQIQEALWMERSLVKSYGPRGTVHLLSTRDLAMWTGALSAIPSPASPFPEGVRLSREQTDEVVAAIATALADADLTADELTEALVMRLGPWVGEPVMPAFQELWPRWRIVTHTAARRGALCFGPNRGRKVTYTYPGRRLPDFQPAAAHTALAELVRRYLYAYGPATPQQFARWLGAPASWAGELFGTLSGDLEPVEVDGMLAWSNAGDTAASSHSPRGVRLLPYFDAYAVGSYPREWVYPDRAAERALARGQAGNFPVLLIDGVVSGVWHQRRSGKQIAITVEPLERLDTAQRRELDEQVERIGAFFEGTPQLTIGTVSVGPHA